MTTERTERVFGRLGTATDGAVPRGARARGGPRASQPAREVSSPTRDVDPGS